MVFCYSEKRKKIKMYYPQITVVVAHCDKSDTKVHLWNCYLLVVILHCRFFWARKMQDSGATFVFCFFCQRNAVQGFQGSLFLVQKVLPSNSFNVASPSNSTFASVLLQILRGNIVYNSVSKREHFCNGVTVENNPDAIRGIP